jgi:hypothetical protein
LTEATKLVLLHGKQGVNYYYNQAVPLQTNNSVLTRHYILPLLLLIDQQMNPQFGLVKQAVSFQMDWKKGHQRWCDICLFWSF